LTSKDLAKNYFGIKSVDFPRISGEISCYLHEFSFCYFPDGRGIGITIENEQLYSDVYSLSSDNEIEHKNKLTISNSDLILESQKRLQKYHQNELELILELENEKIAFGLEEKGPSNPINLTPIMPKLVGALLTDGYMTLGSNRKQASFGIHQMGAILRMFENGKKLLIVFQTLPKKQSKQAFRQAQ